MIDFKRLTLITKSKHLFFKRTGAIGWQKKELSAHSTHLPFVHYLVFDERTSTVYYEFSDEYSESFACSFYERAFAIKNGQNVGDYTLQKQLDGMPEALVVPKKLCEAFPQVPHLLAGWGVCLYTPSSGFAMSQAVRQIKTIEGEVVSHLFTRRDVRELIITDDVRLELSLILAETLNLRFKGIYSLTDL